MSHILVIKPSSLGDIVHTLPAVELVRHAWPDAHITWVVNEELAGLVRLYPGVTEVWPFRRRRWARPWHWAELAAFLRRLRAARFDVAIDFQGLLRSGVMARCSAAPRRIGFANAREGAGLGYTERIRVPADVRHAVDRNLELVRRALHVTGPACFPELRTDPVAAGRWQERLRAAGVPATPPLVAVAPVARWPSKTWPPEFFAESLDHLADRCPQARFWLLGTQAERAAGEGVRAACRTARPANLMGLTSLAELLEGLRQSAVLITNDSGPMHLAAAVGRPVVALFGPTDPARTGPYGAQHTVLRGQCPRAPCFRRVCRDPAGRCRDSFSPATVAAAAAGRLGVQPGTGAGGPTDPVCGEPE